MEFLRRGIANLDARLSKRFRLRDRVETEGPIEFFDVLNCANPSQIQGPADALVPFGTLTQILSGREGQLGIKIEF